MKEKINKIGIAICQCADKDCIPFVEIFNSPYQSLSLYRCGFCARIVESKKAGRVARREDFGDARWEGCAKRICNVK